MKTTFLVSLLLFSTLLTWGQLRLAAVFSDNMVLQQQTEAPVWGWAAYPTQEISIRGSWNNAEVKTKADPYGRWMTKIATPTAGGPFTLTIKAEREIILQNVMIGEVWLCAGQSNMEWSARMGAADAAEEVPKANYPNIRLFHVNRFAADHPQVRGEGSWKPCTPESMKDFSAVGYFFGKKLHLDLNVPIGLINASWGGTPAEAWTPDSLIYDNYRLREASKKNVQEPWGPKTPGSLYNGMIHPLIPFQLAGVIWYQGETNAKYPFVYKELMEALILGWRTKFKKQLPFYYAQIAPFAQYGPHEKAMLLREQQVNMLSIPHTGMVVTSDLVDNINDIHPKYKRPVGERLANYALAETYGKKGLTYKSPVYKSMKIEKGKIVLSFNHVPTGLMSKGKELTEFTIAGEDGKFVPATAKIVGNTVEVYAKQVRNPVAVRFAWSNGPQPNLFSKEGLPVSSFRTDDWDTEP